MNKPLQDLLAVLPGASHRKKRRAFGARVLASASRHAPSTARKTARRNALFVRVASPILARTFHAARDLAAREYSRAVVSRYSKPRVVVPLAGIALAAALLAFGAARANAKATARDESPQISADDASDASRVLARAEADFDNAQPGRRETEWGRLVADAMKSEGRADIALVNAATLESGTLPQGDVTGAEIDALLTYSDDEIVTRKISGAQLRAALELAVKDVPNDSPRFLHVAGIAATFDAKATGARLRDLKVNGQIVQNSDVFTAAMPIGLSQGAGGFFNIWGKDESAKTGGSLHTTIARYAAKRARLSPDAKARIAPS